MSQRAEVESRVLRLEEEMRDPQTKVELETWKPKAVPSTKVEPLEVPRG